MISVNDSSHDASLIHVFYQLITINVHNKCYEHCNLNVILIKSGSQNILVPVHPQNFALQSIHSQLWFGCCS